MIQCLMRALWMVILDHWKCNAVDIVIAKAYTEASSLSTFCCWSESRSLKNLQTFWRMGWKGLLQDYQVDSCPYPAAARADDRQHHHQASSQVKENRKTVNECSISTIMVLILNTIPFLCNFVRSQIQKIWRWEEGYLMDKWQACSTKSEKQCFLSSFEDRPCISVQNGQLWHLIANPSF